MRITFIFCILILLTNLSHQLSAQTVEWSKTWGDGENQESFAGVALSTGDFVTSVSGQTGVILVKYDSAGEIIWTSVVGSNEAYSLIVTQDEGFIISGLTGTQYVVKTDSLGNIEWSNELSLGSWGRARDAIQTPDGGYMVTGDTVGDNSGSAFILKLDGNGQQQWVEYFDLSNWDIGNSIVQTSDNEYIIAGSTRMRSGHGLDALLIKIDNEGNMIWQKVFGKTGNEEIYDMLQLANGDLILVGYSDSYMNKGEDIWLVKANALGDSVWSKNYGGASDDRGRSITQTNDGGFAFAGSYWGNQGEDFIIVRTDIQGEQLWSKLMGGSKGEQARSIAKTIDFSFILTGVTSSFGNGGGDVWTVKIGFSPIPIISSETILIDIDHDGFAETILNGSESYHPEGASIVSYSWLLNNSEIGNESQISVTLPTGTNQVMLTITDENGSSNSTTIDITVVPGDLPTPVIIADNKWIDTDKNGYAAGTLDGTSSNHSAGYAIVDYKWKYGGTTIGTQSTINATFSTGTNRVYLVVTDENGLVDSASSDINVHAQLIQTEGPISSAVSSIGDSLFFSSSTDDRIYHFDREGNIKWSLIVGGEIQSTTTVGPSDRIYVGSSDTRLYAFNLNGNFEWDLSMGGIITASPAVTPKDILFVGINTGRMFSINGVDGSINWNYLTGGPINSSASISDSGVVYFGSDDGKLYALNTDGTLKWSFTTGGAVQSSPALDTLGNVYFGSNDGNLYALNSSGTQLWNYSTSGEINSSPVIGADGTVYFGSADSSVYAVSSTGQLVWSYRSSSPVNGTGALSFNGILYIGTDNGKLLALSPTGEMLWYYQTNGALTAPPLITVDNMIYVGSADGAIYGMVDPNLLGLSKRTLADNSSQWPTFQQNNQRTGQRSGDVFGPVLSVALLANPIIGSYYDLYVFSDEALQATPAVTLNDVAVEMSLESQVGDYVYHSSVHVTQIGMNNISVTATDLVGNESEYESSFTFGKLAFNMDNQISHNELGITFMIPGNHLMTEGNLLLSSLDLAENRDHLKNIYPSADFTAKRSDGEIFIIETNSIFTKEYKLSYNPKDNSAVTFFSLASSGWQPLTTYTDESYFAVWAYSNKPGIYGIFEGGELTVVPTEFNLSDAFPNPFNLSTTIRYVVPVEGDFKENHSSKVALNIYNIRGQLVKKVVSREQTPGMYEVSWNGSNESGRTVATGIYLMRLSVGDNISTKKLTVLK